MLVTLPFLSAISLTTSNTEAFLFPPGQGGGVRGNKKLGVESGEFVRRGEAGKGNVVLVGVGVDMGVRRNLSAVGDIGLSKMDSGDAGKRGVALRKIDCWLVEGSSGVRYGFVGELGETRERIDANGDGVSGSQ
jgi:hypothetical protein